MSPRRVQDLIAAWYGGSYDRFVADNPAPVLIGLGVLEAKLVRTRSGTRTTYLMDLVRLFDEQVKGSPLIAGIAFPVRLGPESVGPSVALGRSAGCDVVLPDLSISEVHCRMAQDEEGWTIRDEGSTNGTAVNGVAVPPPASARVAVEDLVTIGRCSFLFYTPRTFFSYLQLERR